MTRTSSRTNGSTPPSIRSPSRRIASRWAPRAMKLTSLPPRANSAPKYPPRPPDPTTATFITPMKPGYEIRDEHLVHGGRFAATHGKRTWRLLSLAEQAPDQSRRSLAERTSSSCLVRSRLTPALPARTNSAVLALLPRLPVCVSAAGELTPVASAVRDPSVASRDPGSKTGSKLRRNHDTPETYKA